MSYNVGKEGDIMAVYKKNKKWYYRGKYKLEDGSWKDYNRLGGDSKKVAVEAERAFLIKVYDEVSNRSQVTFKELSDLYLHKMEKVKKAATLQSDMYGYKQCSSLNDMRINLIRKSSIEMIFKRLDQEGKTTTYINKIYSILNKTFKFAIKEKLLERNPMEDIELFKRPNELKQEMLCWTYGEFKLFSDAFTEEDYKYKVFFDFLYFMGCRRGEALALSWKDIDLEKGTVRIYKTVNQQLKGVHFLITPPKTKNSNRIIQMPKILRSEMEEFYKSSSEQYGFNDEFFIFYGDRPFNIKTLNNRLDEYCLKAGVKRIRIHDFRHSHASFLINKGANDKAVADRLGNTVAMTREVYSHLFKETEDELINIIDMNV